jgi:nucleotide-binding universal stress UspA family protein
MTSPVHHVAVMFDASAAAERALREAASIADEHDAHLTVISAVPHDRRRIGCASCSVRRTSWNRAMDEVARADLAKARALLGGREPEPRFHAVSGRGVSAVRQAALELGCHLLVVPGRRFWRRPKPLRPTAAAEMRDVEAS